MNRELFFPTPIYIKDVGSPELNQKLEQNILNWMQQDKGVSRTNVNGWHSTSDMADKPEYKELIQILFEAQHYIYKEEYLDSEPFLGNMWANVNPPGGYNRAHMHPNSLWSGVYYVKTPPNCGHLALEDPRSVSLMSMPRRIQTNEAPPSRIWRETKYDPVAGRLIMFPSWVNHYVEPNRSNDVRISVSFNFMQRCFLV